MLRDLLVLALVALLFGVVAWLLSTNAPHWIEQLPTTPPTSALDRRRRCDQLSPPRHRTDACGPTYVTGMQMRTDPRSPIMSGVYLLSPSDVDMKHARKRAAHVDPAALPHPNRRLRRKLARHVAAHPDNRVRLEVDELLDDHSA